MATFPREIVLDKFPKVGTIHVTVRLSNRAKFRFMAGKLLMKWGAWLMFCDLDLRRIL